MTHQPHPVRRHRNDAASKDVAEASYFMPPQRVWLGRHKNDAASKDVAEASYYFDAASKGVAGAS